MLDEPRHPIGFVGISELPMHVGNSETIGRDFQLGGTFTRALLFHPGFKLNVPYMFFNHLDEMNAMVKSVLYLTPL